MNGPSDHRPLRAANQLRLVVVIPVLVTVAGVIILASKLSARFRTIEEPPDRGHPPVPLRNLGPAGRSLNWVGGGPVSSARTNASTNVGTAITFTESSRGKQPTASSPEAFAPSPDAQPQPPIRAADLVVTGSTAQAEFSKNGLVGTVILRGVPPPEQEIAMDPSCGALHPGAKPRTRFYVVGTNSALAEVFVMLERVTTPGQWQPSASPVEIRQRGCEYLPYVTAAQLGQVIRVFNDDPLMHNVHPTPAVDGNKEQNKAQLPKGAPLDFVFVKPELFLRFKCDVHPWMFAYVSVVEHPFFSVTDSAGRFAIPGPPPGSYNVQLLHRKAGGRQVPVNVRAGKRLVITVTLDIADRAKGEATVTEE